MIAQKIDAKFDMKNFANLHRLKNSHFILESKMVELNENKNSKQPDDQMQCENFFYLGNK